MKHFNKLPASRPLNDPWVITTEDWECWWTYKGKYRKLFIPSGNVSDGGSIPRVAWTASGLIPYGEAFAGYLPHDNLYRSKGGRKAATFQGCRLINENGNAIYVSREEADWVMREFMIAATVDRLKARRAWRWVRALGWMHWGKQPPSGAMPRP